MSANSIRPTGRLIKRGLRLLAITTVLLLALCGLSTGLILCRGPMNAVSTVHDAMSALRPYVLVGQAGVIGLLWWFWAQLVRRANFIPAVEAAWLAVRHRLALWALGLTALGGVLWFPR